MIGKFWVCSNWVCIFGGRIIVDFRFLLVNFLVYIIFFEGFFFNMGGKGFGLIFFLYSFKGGGIFFCGLFGINIDV